MQAAIRRSLSHVSNNYTMLSGLHPLQQTETRLGSRAISNSLPILPICRRSMLRNVQTPRVPTSQLSPSMVRFNLQSFLSRFKSGFLGGENNQTQPGDEANLGIYPHPS